MFPADGAPQVLEGAGRPGEVDPGQVRVGQRHPGHRLAVPGHHVDHAGRQPGRLEQGHRVVRRELLGGRRLPHHHVAEQRGRGRQVPGDRGEVERRDREHEALERPVLHPVPGARARTPAARPAAAGRRRRCTARSRSARRRRRSPPGRPTWTGRGPSRRSASRATGPASRSAARRKTAARSSNDSARQAAGRAAGGGDRRDHVRVGGVASSPRTCRKLCGCTTATRSPDPMTGPAADGHGQLGPLSGELLDLGLERRRGPRCPAGTACTGSLIRRGNPVTASMTRRHLPP